MYSRRAAPPSASRRSSCRPRSMSFAVTARNAADEDKLNQCLRRMKDEDPTLDVHHDEQTGDHIVGGPVADARRGDRRPHRAPLRRGDGAGAAPRAVPRDDHEAAPKAEGKHKKQSGGRGQYADCWVEVEPLPRGAGFEFVDKIVGGAIPRSFIPAVEKGVRGGDGAGRARRLPGGGRPGDALRRQVPPGGLVGDGVQDRRRHRHEGGPREGRPGAAGAGDARRDHGAVGARRRRDGRPQLPARPPARHGGPRATTRSCAPRCRWPRCSSTRRTCAP